MTRNRKKRKKKQKRNRHKMMTEKRKKKRKKNSYKKMTRNRERRKKKQKRNSHKKMTEKRKKRKKKEEKKSPNNPCRAPHQSVAMSVEHKDGDALVVGPRGEAAAVSVPANGVYLGVVAHVLLLLVVRLKVAPHLLQVRRPHGCWLLWGLGQAEVLLGQL